MFKKKIIWSKSFIMEFCTVVLISIVVAGCGGGTSNSNTTGESDNTPPTRLDGSPTGELPSGTTQTNLSISTNETASCRYSTTAGTSFDLMTDLIATDDGLIHSINFTGLSDGNAYNYYIRCRDNADNINTDDYSISFSVALQVAANTYYIDYDTGDDASDGQSTGAPWQHAPGDPKATDNPAAITLQFGDTVLFRGGVVYRGTIIINVDGSAGGPIIYKGDGWGVQKAIIDGSELLQGAWTQCTSQLACGDNPDWQNIYYINAPAGYNFFTTLYEDDQFLWYSQDPNPQDPFYYDRTSDYRVIPPNDPALTITRTTVTDSGFLTQTDPNFWDGAYIAAWRIPNVIVIRAVTGFIPVTDTITFEDLGNDLYTDRDEFYSLLNNLSLIDTAGEYYFDSSNQLIYLWPPSSQDPAGHIYTVAKRRAGIDLNGHSFITIEGLKIQKHFGDFVEYNEGVAIRSLGWNNIATNIIIRNNDITKHRTMEGSGAVRLYNVDGAVIENNNITDNQRSVGILAGNNNITIKNNFVSRNSRQGIWFMGTSNSRIVGNTVTDIRGTHANGISVYMDSSNILVAHNIVTNAPSPFTFEASHNISVINNVFDAGDGGSNVNEWGSAMTGTVLFLNNTLVRNNRNAALNIGNSSNATYIVKNNIIDGYCPDAASTDWSHNIYTGLAWCQDPDTDFGAGDFLQEDLGQIFIDAVNGNFYLFGNSAAVDKGTDITPYLPVGAFPDFDFSVDRDGNTRPQDGDSDGTADWDIGAYEYAP